MTVHATLSEKEWLELQERREHKRASKTAPPPRIPRNAMTTQEEIDYLTAHIRKVLNEGPQEPKDSEPPFVREVGVSYNFLYGRVSKSTQETSMVVQREELMKWLDTQNNPLGRVRIEAISGRKFSFFDRPEARKLVKEMDKGDTLVVHKLDRLGRKLQYILEVVEWLKDSGIRLVVLAHGPGEIDSTSAVGKYMLRSLSIVSEFEVDMNSERTSDAYQSRKARGLVTCGEPRIGYKRVWTTDMKAPRGHTLVYVRDAAEIAICREIYERRNQGESRRSIAEDFWHRKVKTADGKDFAPPQPSRNCITRYGENRLIRAYDFYDELVIREQGLAHADDEAAE